MAEMQAWFAGNAGLIGVSSAIENAEKLDSFPASAVIAEAQS